MIRSILEQYVCVKWMRIYICALCRPNVDIKHKLYYRSCLRNYCKNNFPIVESCLYFDCHKNTKMNHKTFRNISCTPSRIKKMGNKKRSNTKTILDDGLLVAGNTGQHVLPLQHIVFTASFNYLRRRVMKITRYSH